MPLTLEQARAMEKAGLGRIYWYYADRSYGSTPEPMWIPKDLLRYYFPDSGTPNH